MERELLTLYVQCAEALLEQGQVREAQDLFLAAVYLGSSLGETAVVKKCQYGLVRIDKDHPAARPDFEQNADLRERAGRLRQEYSLERVRALKQALEGGSQRPSRLQRGLASFFGAAPRFEAKKSFEELKRILHAKLVEKLDLARVADLDPDTIRREIRLVLERLCDEVNPLLTRMERERLIDEVLDETFGFGPLEYLLKDPTVQSILVFGPEEIYVHRRGKLEKTDITFRDAEHLRQIVDRVFACGGRRLQDGRSLQSTQLADGSQVSVVLPPVAGTGPYLRIDRSSLKNLGLEDLLNAKTLTPEMCMLLEAAVKAGLNILISGAAGSGKTTLLNVLGAFLPSNDMAVVIEHPPGLDLRHAPLLRLIRSAREAGKEATPTELLLQALAWRPGHILFDGCDGPEALDALLAMKTCPMLMTLAAQSPEDCVYQLETLALMHTRALPASVVRRQISSLVNVIVQVDRLRGDRRKVSSITEVAGLENDQVVLREIFRYQQQGIDAEGRALGQFEVTGEPRFLNRLECAGIRLPEKLFVPRVLLRD